MWDVASTTSILTTAMTDIGTILTLLVGAVFAVALGLMGAGYGMRLFKKHILGKKF